MISPLTSAYTDCQDKMAHTKVEARTIDGHQVIYLRTWRNNIFLCLTTDWENKDQKLFRLASLC